MNHDAEQESPKPLFWIASSRKNLIAFPRAVRRAFGFALWQAQNGELHHKAKPLKGFKGSGVLEVVEDFIGSTYRAVYTVRFRGAVYVVHAFQKKSKKGNKTPTFEIDLIRRRLQAAEVHHEAWRKTHQQKDTPDSNHF